MSSFLISVVRRADVSVRDHPASICIPVHPLLFSLLLSKLTWRCHLHLTRAKLQPSRFCSQRHFNVVPKCRHVQNCQTLLTSMDAMHNSFNTRPRRYPYHWCNGMFTPPCILWACTRQLVIPLIYSSWPAEDQTAQTTHSLCPSEVNSGSCVILYYQPWYPQGGFQEE